MAELHLQHAPVAVIGAGTMGIGIAQLAAMHGHPTHVYDVDPQRVESAFAALKQQLQKRVDTGKMAADLLQLTLSNLNVAADLHELADSQLIVEAIVENKDVKQKLFQQLADICSPETIFASNTSSISITAIAANIPHPERVVGLHFFNPAPVMKLVEVIAGLKTDPAISDALVSLMTAWKKVPVRAKSTPGFIVNRIARPYYAEGFRALQENATTPEQLDFIMRECGRFSMGPCELTDLIGQDINFSVTQSVYDAFFDEPRYRPSLIQKELVDAGCFGRKTQQGFYDYRTEHSKKVYQLPVIYSKSPEKIEVVVKGDWSHSQGLIKLLQQSLHINLRIEAAPMAEILIGDVSLRLSMGQSAEIDYATQKVVLMDWHGDWSQAKAIAVTASPACTAIDQKTIEQLFIGLNIIPIWSQDHPGLYVLRTIAMLVNEGCEAVLHQIASEQDIDAAMKFAVNYPKGPFQWAQELGYNIILQTLQNLYRIYGEERYRPNLYLLKKAAQGHVSTQQPLRAAS
ncbi:MULTISPECIES: 3-hydroxyacyl-CoA dehydrogenase [Acinetobacter]|uniref:3-hydroxyacyl-CoA dehydrogenase n=1 Tax=Acinetobacter TaxID=469 RepID=UPI0015D36123|nr:MULTISPECIES: 3-hydroxyacyl-CoA dehydrogenase [Acinetobacter]MCL6238908.1 3-hydroxyacyl-CoA dehydrogenase [Acinetobacter amyesii]